MPLCKKTPPEIVSEILHQIVSEVCKNTPPKSKKRSIDKTEIEKKKGDKKRQKKNTIEPSGEQLLAEQTLAMKSPAMQALWEKPQNFNLVQDRSSKKQKKYTYTRKSSNGNFGEKGKIAPRANDLCPRCL